MYCTHTYSSPALWQRNNAGKNYVYVCKWTIFWSGSSYHENLIATLLFMISCQILCPCCENLHGYLGVQFMYEIGCKWNFGIVFVLICFVLFLLFCSLDKNLNSVKGSRLGNSGNKLELWVLTQLHHVPWATLSNRCHYRFQFCESLIMMCVLKLYAWGWQNDGNLWRELIFIVKILGIFCNFHA